MDIILYNIAIGLISILIGYFFGAIPFGIIIGKVFFHRDPRNEGSGNSGGTNVGRVFGKKVGFICIILDMVKCIIPMIAIWAILKFSPVKELFFNHLGKEMFDDGVLYIYLSALGALIGHCYPVYVGFRGGKAVSTYAGFGIATSWGIVVLGIITFFTTLKKTKYVSLSSIMLAIFSTIFSWLLFGLNFIIPEAYRNIVMWGNGNYMIFGWEYAVVVTVGAILLIVRHTPNIKRLLKGTESKIKWMK